MEIKVINNVDLDDLDLSVRAWNCLRRTMINNVQDIVDNIDNLPRVRNLGQKCYDEILEKIKPYIEEVDKICITNYDRIKSMSVEGMAELLTYCVEDLVNDITSLECSHCEENHCTKCIKQWLLQEVSKNDYIRYDRTGI